MALQKAFMPYGGYWSTPFVKWQGSFADLHPMKFAAELADPPGGNSEPPGDVAGRVAQG